MVPKTARAVGNANSCRGTAIASALALAFALTGCSGSGPTASDTQGAPDAGQGVPPASTALAPPPPAIAPELPDVSDRDRDHDHIDDALSTNGRDRDRDDIEVILNGPAVQRHLDAFVRLGGLVQHVFSDVSYGWTGSIAHGELAALRDELGSDLRLVAAPKPTILYLDEATRTGRVRPIWASNFAGLSSGASGNANITIAILDTGVDGTHTDLSGRMAGWKDYTSDGDAVAADVGEHGTHVASIALGSGAAFGLGPGTLHYTNSGSLSAIGAGSFVPGVIHTPSYFGGNGTLTVSSSASFVGGSSATFYQVTSADPNGTWGFFTNSTGTSPRTASGSITSSTAARYSDALLQTSPASLSNFAVANSVSNYPAVGDGFNVLRGVAPSCKWFGAKVFTDAGTGNTADIGAALDDMVANRVALNVKVINMSLGVSTGTDSTLRSKANNAVNAGIVVVAAAGNNGPSQTITDPGLANKVLTIGASNDKNELTSYTSIGSTPTDSSMDYKPDILAPGGSSYRSMILAADSNTKDAASSNFADLVSNDYSVKQGTSMASPFAAGAAALLIDALQQSGTSWSLTGSAQPLLVKMLLSASATETNIGREQGLSNPPTLGRAAAPKDSYEGFGMLNPDAAIEAITTSMTATWTGNASNTAPARLEWERRAWGRKVSLINGSTVTLNLSVPNTADLDLYLYAGSGDANGAPVVRASSTNAALDSDESITFTSSTTETAYVFVKRISGYGSFSLTSTTGNQCGNGLIDAGEQCDPGAAGATTCCTATCQAVSAGTSCSDGNACTQVDTCQAGVCVGSSAKTCGALDQCHDAGSCNPTTGVCSNPSKADGSTCNDGNACTQSDACVAGACSGSNPVVCTAQDQCHGAGSCNPSTGSCSSPAKADGTACNDGNACTQSDTCVAGACSGGSPVLCAATDQCHNAGSCNPTNGLCSTPAKPDGSHCNDGNACTQTDQCLSGSCIGSNPVQCVASDGCHSSGSCDPIQGTCTNPVKPDGSGCDDGNACTKTDQCLSGTCQGSNPVLCSASAECQAAGSCSPLTGQCSAPVANDGTPCSLGSCSSGLCVAAAGGAGGAAAGGASNGGGGAGGANAGDSGSSAAGSSAAGSSAAGSSAAGGAGPSAGGASNGAAGSLSAAGASVGAAGSPSGGASAGGASTGGTSGASTRATSDAGSASTPTGDAGAPDTSGGNGGSSDDAGANNGDANGRAGSMDPGTSNAPSNGQGSGCGCSEAGATPKGAPVAWLVVAVVAASFRRRKQSRA